MQGGTIFQANTLNTVPRGGSGFGDPVAQGAGHAIVEIAHRVAGEVPEQIEPHIHAGAHHGPATEPAAQTPQSMLYTHEGDEQCQGTPEGQPVSLRGGHGVHQNLHAHLHTDGAAGGADHQQEQAGKMERPAPNIVQEKESGTPQKTRCRFGRVRMLDVWHLSPIPKPRRSCAIATERLGVRLVIRPR